MTIQSTDRKAGPFLSGTALPFEFKVFSKEDIAVIYTNAEGVEVVLVLDSDYSVSLNADQDNNPGGTATLTTPIVSGDRANIIGDLAYDQGTDIRNQGGFEPEIIEDALDRATIQIQQLKEISDRTLKTAPGDSRTGDELLADIFEAEENAATSAAAAEESANRVDLGALDDAVADAQAAELGAQTAQGLAEDARDAAIVAQTAAELLETNAETAEANAELAQLAAEAARDAAQLSKNIWPTTAAGIGNGVAGATITSGGSGGTNGTFALAFSGGTQILAPAGVFTVVGGAVVSVTINYSGYYSAGTPTFSFAASAGLTGTNITAVMAANTSVNEYFSVPVSNSGDSLILYRVDAGPVATEVARYPSASAVSPLRDFPTNKLISAWLFDENEGNIVFDRYGPNNIDLTSPVDPNVTRTNFGLRVSNGLIQTPTITGAKQIVMLYRTGINETLGFLISGGSGSGSGITQEGVNAAETNRYAGSGFDFHPVAFRPTLGSSAFELNRGGWGLLSRDMTTTFNTIIGFGGRHSTTTSRCANFEIAAAFVFNATLSATEEEQLHNWVRREGVKRGIYIHRDDCPVREDVYIVAGESNADGRSTVADLSSADRALDLSRLTRIIPANGTIDWRHADGYELTFNGQVTAPTVDFGPDFGVAFERRADAPTILVNARILKLGKGSTFMAPSSTGITAQSSWNVTELNNAGLFWRFIRHAQRAFQEMLSEGIGWKGVRMGFWIGLNDASNTAYASSAAVYEGYLQAFIDTIETQFSGVDLTLLVFRAHTSDPSSNPTALANVHAGTDNFAAANTNVTSIDTDSYGLEPDMVHYNAAGSKAMGQILHG